jgi:DNA modification methylase
MEPSATGVRNPKPNASGVGAVYPYYAGFSSGFVGDVLRELDLAHGATILDPWNGSGTTTDVAARHGYVSVGYDINPAATVIASARLATDADVAEATAILRRPRKSKGESAAPLSDLLRRWLGPRSVATLRELEQDVIGAHEVAPLEAGPVTRLSPARALHQVALFNTLRKILREERTTNPTWTRLEARSRRIGVPPGRVSRIFDECASALLARIPTHRPFGLNPRPEIRVASSLGLPLHGGSVSAVITSPPYCTRIDYAIATLPELALLGYDNEAIRGLRDSMIGTPTVADNDPIESSAWGVTCVELLRRISGHPSKDSRTYYYKIYRSYFDRMSQSLYELDRVLLPGGSAVIVVQDSYYKDVHIDLQSIFHEMTSGMGWSLKRRVDFNASHAWSDIHPGISRYRARILPCESVLFFRKTV